MEGGLEVITELLGAGAEAKVYKGRYHGKSHLQVSRLAVLN